MADQDRFEDDVRNEPETDDSDFWEDTPLSSEETDARQTDIHEWAGSPEAEELADDTPRTPPPRIHKRRIVCGVVFLVLGLIGVLADGFDLDVGLASTVASLVGAVVLLVGLIASERRRREIIQLS